MRILATAAIVLMSTGIAGADCRDEVLSIIEAQKAAGPFRIEMRGDGGGQEIVSAGEVILPDRFHMKMPEGEMIMVPEGIWMKQGGAWMQLPEQMASMMQGMIGRAAEAPASNIQAVECLGDETVDGASFKAYRYEAEDDVEGMKAKAKVKLFADPATGLPARLEIDGESMGTASRIVQTITFDPSITIEPPK